jgi:hypothetical protein
MAFEKFILILIYKYFCYKISLFDKFSLLFYLIFIALGGNKSPILPPCISFFTLNYYLYKRRWQVELFFKWIKQNLKIKSFWGTSENAVFSQIWGRLLYRCCYGYAEHLTDNHFCPSDIADDKTTLLCKDSIPGLYTNKPLPPKLVSPQLLLEGLP